MWQFVWRFLCFLLSLFLFKNFVSLFEVFFWGGVLIFFFCFCVCVELWKRRKTNSEEKDEEEEENMSNKKGGERWKRKATWEAINWKGWVSCNLALATKNGRRGLLPSPWGLNCSKGLVLSLRFSDFFYKKFVVFIYLFIDLIFFPIFCWVFKYLFLEFDFFLLFIFYYQ